MCLSLSQIVVAKESFNGINRQYDSIMVYDYKQEENFSEEDFSWRIL